MSALGSKKLIISAIAALVAVLHIFGPARQASGMWHNLYYSYFSDLTLPFVLYFLLCANDSRSSFLHPWWAKAGLVFCAASSAEILQYFGIHAMGATFDPVDIAAYAFGVLFAAAVERSLFTRCLRGWDK